VELFRPGYVKATLSVWIMQFCGGAIFVGLAVWLPSIFVKMGFPTARSFYFTAAITGAGALGNLFGGFMLDRIGRRGTLSLCSIAGGLLMLVWGMASSEFAIVALGAVTAFFAFGAPGGPLFTYTSEVYPTRFRATGTGWAAGWQRIGGIVGPAVFGVLLASGAVNYSFFVLMAGVLLFGGLSMLALGYETRGKSLEEIEASLSK
jgi:putative MFS transporter